LIADLASCPGLRFLVEVSSPVLVPDVL
jgi:hypothetical protein